jgi:hypothetical protein
MIDSKGFLSDSLFCEWAYIINLDKEVLEVYEGFQEEESDNRFKGDYAKEKYKNVKLNCEISFALIRGSDDLDLIIKAIDEHSV